VFVRKPPCCEEQKTFTRSFIASFLNRLKNRGWVLASVCFSEPTKSRCRPKIFRLEKLVGCFTRSCTIHVHLLSWCSNAFYTPQLTSNQRLHPTIRIFLPFFFLWVGFFRTGTGWMPCCCGKNPFHPPFGRPGGVR